MPMFFLFATMLVLMLMRVYVPLGARPEGKPLKTIGLSLRERSLMQRVNMYAIGLVLLLMALTGVLEPVIELAVVVLALLVLLIPVRCYVTTAGIAINNVLFRPWSDFSGYSVERRRLRLIGRDGVRSLNLSLLPGHQQELVPTLRRYLKPLEQARVAPLAKPSRRRATTHR
jgi:hypothetical protein